MFYGNIVWNWINGEARTYSYYIKVKTERGWYKVWKKRIVNEQFIIKKKEEKKEDNKTVEGDRKRKEKKLEHCWTQHREKKKEKNGHLFRKINSLFEFEGDIRIFFLFHIIKKNE